MAFAAWAEENPSKIYQNLPWALAGRSQISPDLAGRAPDLQNKVYSLTLKTPESE